MFGKNAKTKKELIAQKDSLDKICSTRQSFLDLTKKRTFYVSRPFSFSTWKPENLLKYETRDRTTFDVIYDESIGKYALYDSKGIKVYSKVEGLEISVGAFKQFKATYSDWSSFCANLSSPEKYEIFLKITDDY